MTRTPLRTAAAAGAMAMLAAPGCMVGPDAERPQVDAPAKWGALDPSVTDAARQSRPVEGAPDLARWWATFNDPVLTSLVERAAIGNLDLAAAEARVRAARAQRAIAIGGLLPSVDAFGTASHDPDFTTADGPFVPNTSLFAAGFDASWELDIWGKIRRGIEATDAGIAAAQFGMRDVWVTLAGEVAATYLQLRTAQAQLAIVRGNLAAQQDALDITTRLYETGMRGALDVSNARAQVEATRSRIPRLESLVREQICTLGLLLGQQPTSLLPELTVAAPIPSVPPRIPVGLPSELLLRRPDIRRAEAELHAATARIGVAIGQQFPTISLTAGLGTQSSDAGSLFGLASNYWSAGANATFPLFRGGAIQANIVLQKALADAAIAAYRRQVLAALRDVEVAITNFAQEQARREALAKSVAANVDAVGLAQQLYLAGRTDFLNVIATQRSLLDSQEALAGSEQAIAFNLVALYKALGGGWEDMQLKDGDQPAAEPATAPAADPAASAASARTASSAGSEGIAPSLVAANAPAALPQASASAGDRPASVAARNAPTNASPQPTVSTARTP